MQKSRFFLQKLEFQEYYHVTNFREKIPKDAREIAVFLFVCKILRFLQKDTAWIWSV